MIDNVTLSVDVDVLEDSAAKITSGWSLCAAVIHCVLLPSSLLIHCLCSNKTHLRRSIRCRPFLLELLVFNSSVLSDVFVRNQPNRTIDLMLPVLLAH